jgi:hypothetical protein
MTEAEIHISETKFTFVICEQSVSTNNVNIFIFKEQHPYEYILKWTILSYYRKSGRVFLYTTFIQLLHDRISTVVVPAIKNPFDNASHPPLITRRTTTSDCN